MQRQASVDVPNGMPHQRRPPQPPQQQQQEQQQMDANAIAANATNAVFVALSEAQRRSTASPLASPALSTSTSLAAVDQPLTSSSASSKGRTSPPTALTAQGAARGGPGGRSGPAGAGAGAGADGAAQGQAAGGKQTMYEWLQTLSKFIGPGYLVAIGYFDPGNWATDLAAGSEFGYRLLFIILLSNIMAVVLQSLCVKLGVVTGLDLASACRKYCPPWLNWILYIFCEIAIMACDLAEVIGSAIALNLLFGLPLFAGVLITALDVMIILMGWNAKHIKFYEFAIIGLVLAVGGCFAILISKSNPVWSQVFLGFVPSPAIFTERSSLYIAVGIIGATVMPHNLYLHSAIVRYRNSSQAQEIGEINEVDFTDDDRLSVVSEDRQPLRRKQFLPTSVRMATIDTVIALTFALLVNSSILIVASANFHAIGRTDVADIADAHALMRDLLGPAAGVLFAVALLISGQSSTVTGTLAGQFVMEGFLGSKFRVPAWARRLVTRLLAIVPALVVIFVFGDKALNDLLVFSQIILSLQLPFALWPLIWFTCSTTVMTVKFHGSAPPRTSIAEGLASGDVLGAEAVRLASAAGVEQQLAAEQTPLSNDAGDGRDSCGDSDAATITVETMPSEQSFVNGWLLTIVVVTIGLIVTTLNIVLLVQIATGTTA
ncbi:natural resistance-associated macrophage protein-domain-containing protein [Entophlyctis helioformis]|nr:natural resistance-associated macrophage protein-domain-containing protein [Entophlyctis helioformis]